MRVCDWIADYLYNQGVRNIYGLTGGGASGLNDGFIKHGKLRYLCFHHEQGAGHAAIGESKYTGKIAVVNPTTGCGGTNCATSVLNAWQDSIPLIFISGNVKADTCSDVINQEKNISLRKYGIQEHNIINTVRSMTKFATFVRHPEDIPLLLQSAIQYATHGRPGPVWLDIPGNVQTAKMPESYVELDPALPNIGVDIGGILELFELLKTAERPLVFAGYGIRQSNTISQFRQFIEKYQLPFASTYGARDYVEYEHPLNIGTVGIKGSRAGNFAVHNADLLLILGSSFNNSQTGYDPKQFSPNSIKVYVDIDSNELDKDVIPVQLKIQTDLRSFFAEVLK